LKIDFYAILSQILVKMVATLLIFGPFFSQQKKKDYLEKQGEGMS
jgi:hypothetical protein